MEVKIVTQRLQTALGKYKYAAIILIVGVLLLCLPGRNTRKQEAVSENVSPSPVTQAMEVEALADILQSIHGAGRVRVLLSVASGERTVYQTDSDITAGKEDGSTRIETVIITDSQRNESGLVQQVNPPTYLGAIIVCDGADDPVVKLAIMQAVAKITGLHTDGICVVKMK